MLRSLRPLAPALEKIGLSTTRSVSRALSPTRSVSRALSPTDPGSPLRAALATSPVRVRLPEPVPVGMTRCASSLALRAGAPVARAVEVPDHATRVREATAAILARAGHAALDPLRPQFHLAPPAQWVNDPNGPLFKNGDLHVFYQVNPTAETWGTIHWGHARTRDLIHWEHLPVALAPEPDLGEEHCFSGCTVDLGDHVVALYTSIGPERAARDGAVQCIAVSRDPELKVWEKRAAAPILGAETHGEEKIYELRDPFVFAHEGETYMVLGGSLVPDLGGRSVVAIYRARDAELTDWEYRGILYEHPDAVLAPNVTSRSSGHRLVTPNIECPNFFPLGDRWVLSFSPHGQTRYLIGSFDSEAHRFVPDPKAGGVLDLSGSDDFYAPTSTADDAGRRIVFGWVGGFDKRPGFVDRGWNGCLSLPRVLTQRPDGGLGIEPAAELEGLRSRTLLSARGLDLEGGRVLEGVSGQGLEIAARIDLAEAKQVGLVLARSDDGARGVRVAIDRKGVEIDGVKTPFALLPDEVLDLRLYVDRSLLELFINGRAALTRVVDVQAGDLGVELFSAGGCARVETLDVFELESCTTHPG